ncbi:hypothetical protein QF001_002219 [Paraburkholderia youngii]
MQSHIEPLDQPASARAAAATHFCVVGSVGFIY